MQISLANDQLKTAQDASRQTDESLVLTRLSRAALVTMGPPEAAIATVGSNAGKELLVNAHVKNVGQLPARVIEVKYKAFNAPYLSNVSEFVNAKGGWLRDPGHLILPPGIETLIGFAADGKLFPKDVEFGTRPDATTLYVCIDITYDDILKIHGRTRTVFYFSPADNHRFLTDAAYSVMDQAPRDETAK